MSTVDSHKSVLNLISRLEDYVNSVQRGELVPRDKAVIGEGLLDDLRKDKQQKTPKLAPDKNDAMVRFVTFCVERAKEAISTN